jgi:tetratricopeptide (TPR) repeat protein
MFFRSLLPLLLMATTTHGAAAADRVRLGEQALATGLWEIAAGQFEARLAEPGLDEGLMAAATIRLAEAKLRDGRAAEALVLLSVPALAADPEASFWKAQALAATGDSTGAIEILAPLAADPRFPFFSEAVFTMANLELARGGSAGAMDFLQSLDSTGDPALVASARLRKVEILLDQGRVADAREALPAEDAVRARDASVRAFLDASIMLRENRPAEAAVVFRDLIDKPQGQTSERYHMAAAGLGQALLATGQASAAVSFLVSFLQDHPSSTQLDRLFHQLGEASRENADIERSVIEALEIWTSPGEFPVLGPVPVLGADAAAAWPAVANAPDITAHALLARALILRRAATPDAVAESRRLLVRLRLDFPAHPLAARALYELAVLEIEAGKPRAANAILELLKDSSPDSSLHGRSGFLQAGIAHEAGDSAAASGLFEEASRTLPENDARFARFNSAVLIVAGDGGGAGEAAADPGLAADVQLERALSLEEVSARIAALKEFLDAHPQHPRAAGARMAAAEAAIAITPPDLPLARAQLETFAADPDQAASIDPERLAMARLRLADLADESVAAIGLAREITGRFPGTPAADDAAFILGRKLFQTEAYNESRMVLEQLAGATPHPARAEVAWLLAARSAALVPTGQSHQDSLALFRKVIDGAGPLAPVAAMEMARLMIDMNRLDDAAAFLRVWFGSLEKSDPMRMPAGLLLGEAIYAKGSASPDSPGEALAVYDSLLEGTAPHSALNNRLQYLRGRTLEQVPDERKAFSAYYSVLETNGAPDEWHYFELCGFRALTLLEKAGRWPAAIACARRIASFNGPRAAEATERAGQLQLTHMIWED